MADVEADLPASEVAPSSGKETVEVTLENDVHEDEAEVDAKESKEIQMNEFSHATQNEVEIIDTAVAIEPDAIVGGSETEEEEHSGEEAKKESEEVDVADDLDSVSASVSGSSEASLVSGSDPMASLRRLMRRLLNDLSETRSSQSSAIIDLCLRNAETPSATQSRSQLRFDDSGLGDKLSVAASGGGDLDARSAMNDLASSIVHFLTASPPQSATDGTSTPLSPLTVSCLSSLVLSAVDSANRRGAELDTARVSVEGMCTYMLDRVELALRNLFHFKHYFALHLMTDAKRCRLFALQCALYRRFPLLTTEGCTSLARPPVFYGTKQCSLFGSGSDASKERKRVSWELLQTDACFKTIPSATVNSLESMDLRSLEQEIERDQCRGKLPCAVVAAATDDLHKMRQVCNRQGLWLHVEADSSALTRHSLLLAASSSLPRATGLLMSCADSIATHPSLWLAQGRAALSDVTLAFVREDMRDTPPPLLGLTTLDFGLLFPLWLHLCLAPATHCQMLRARVEHSLALVSRLKSLLCAATDEATDALFSAICFGPDSCAPHVLRFSVLPLKSVLGFDLHSVRCDAWLFVDYLRSRLPAEVRQALGGSLTLLATDCGLQFAPLTLDAANCLRLKDELLSRFVQSLLCELQALRQCVAQRASFAALLTADCKAELQWIDATEVLAAADADMDEELCSELPLAPMCALGAFKYVPSYYSQLANAHSLNAINASLLKELTAGSQPLADSFHWAQHIDGSLVLAVNPPKGVAVDADFSSHVHAHIVKAQKSMSFPESVLQEMDATIREAIGAAQRQVADESAAADYSADALMRNIPVVGSVYGWLLPDEHTGDRKLSGRSFDMVSRRLSATAPPSAHSLHSDPSLETDCHLTDDTWTQEPEPSQPL